MGRILLAWHDRDGTRTTHEFDTPQAAEPWLRSVLAEYCPPEELEAGGYTVDGLGMFHCYTDEGYDDVGSIEVYINGVGAGPADLYG